MIPGGYIMLARKTIESDIFKKPPLYLKVWVYLLAKAQHKPANGLQRGELFTTANEIREACAYRIGYRKELPTKKQIYQILGHLKGGFEPSAKGTANGSVNGAAKGTADGAMIEVTKVAGGMKIKVLKFDDYQDARRYEARKPSGKRMVSNPEGHSEGEREGHGEAVHNGDCKRATNRDSIPYKKERMKEIPPESPKGGGSIFADYADGDAELLQALTAFEAMRKQKKKPMTERARRLLLSTLDQLAGERRTRIAILDQSTLNCWTSVYPLKTPLEEAAPAGGGVEIVLVDGKRVARYAE